MVAHNSTKSDDRRGPGHRAYRSPNQSEECSRRGFWASLASLFCIFEIVFIILNHVLSIKLSQIRSKMIRNYSNKSKNDSKVIRHDFEQKSPTSKSMSEPKVFSRVQSTSEATSEVAVNLQTK